MEKFRNVINTKVESLSAEEIVDSLIGEFPEELQENLWAEIHNLDDFAARDFLTSKLIERKIALLPQEYTEIPKYMEVVTQNPEAVEESLERAHEQGSQFFLGKGQNAEVIASTRQEAICYKTLFMKRAKQVGANIAREALIQYALKEALRSRGLDSYIPAVKGYVKTAEVQAIKMEKIEGYSLRQIMERVDGCSVAADFDLDTFFEQLENVVINMNELGYFHRDLFGNAGNVICRNDGSPVLIDFGGAVKAVDYNADEATYQIVPGGQRYRKNDVAGVRDLKNRMKEYLAAA